MFGKSAWHLLVVVMGSVMASHGLFNQVCPLMMPPGIDLDAEQHKFLGMAMELTEDDLIDVEVNYEHRNEEYQAGEDGVKVWVRRKLNKTTPWKSVMDACREGIPTTVPLPRQRTLEDRLSNAMDFSFETLDAAGVPDDTILDTYDGYMLGSVLQTKRNRDQLNGVQDEGWEFFRGPPPPGDP